MDKFAVVLCLFLGAAAYGYAGPASRIELSDGSLINGEVVSLDKGVYTIRTESAGELKIEMTRIRRIEAFAAVPEAPEIKPVTPVPEQETSDFVGAMRQKVEDKMKTDPRVVKSIAELKEDPDFQELLKDPRIIEAIKSQDINSLLSNDKFMKLLSNPAIKDIADKIQTDN